MAMFHFRLKSDKKPNGAKISAVKHVEYINREGSYSEQNKDATKFAGNCISAADNANAFGGLNALLYKTNEFGSIKNSTHGIEVTAKASTTTIAIALILADEALEHKPLIISGSPAFRKAVLKAALQAKLPISFDDQSLQADFELLKEYVKNDQEQFIANGGRIFTRRPNPQPAPAPAHGKTVEYATKVGLRLPSLSQLAVVRAESEGTDLLLQDDESRQLVELAKEQYKLVRWDFSSEQARLVKCTADKILENISEAQKESSAVSHVEYINREKAFANRGDCLFHDHHLPKWAHDAPKKFFHAADMYEGKGNRRYMEIEFALPNELKTTEQYRQIIDAFIAKHLQNHYYAYAIHSKIGVMSDGQHHPHVHIMFSERIIDDVEKTRERAACNFFKYPARNKKDGSKPSLEERRKHGAPKNRRWADKNFLTELRADFAQIQNEVLERNGFSIRVDHRSLKAQKEEAERNGDSFLARLFNRVPEEYIGVISCHENDEPKIKRLLKFRALRKQHFDLVMKLDELAKETDELETKDTAQISSTRAKMLLDSHECLSQFQQVLRNKMLTAVAEVNKWKRVIISQHDAITQAKLEYMSKAERELWQKYFETLAQKKRLEEFLTILRKPKESQKIATKAYEDILAGVHTKIVSLNVALLAMKSAVQKIENRLEQPDCKKNILLVSHQILQANTHARKMLRRASSDLDKAIDDLRNSLVTQSLEEPQEIFKTREVYDLIRRQFFGLKKEHEKTLDLKLELQQKVISPQRALAMAKNIFVRGEYKKLREAIRRHKKDSQRLAQNLVSFSQQEKIFRNTDWTLFPRATFLQQQYYLTKQRTLLSVEKTRLDQLNLSLQNKQVELDAHCQYPEAQHQIEVIAAGILRKNFRHVRRVEEVDARAKKLAQRMNHAHEQLLILKERLSRDKSSTRYKVVSSNISSKGNAASIIADAILQEPHAVQLVAHSSGNNLEMEKDWELMSELDKDELINRKIIREL